jgi:3'-5' exoribonuclease
VKSHYVKDLVQMPVGETFKSTFRLKSPQILQTKTGKSYLFARLADKTGEIEAKWWDGCEHHLNETHQKRYATISGKIDDYKGKTQIIIQSIPEWLDEPIDLTEYELNAPLPFGKLYSRLEAHIASVIYPPLKTLLKLIFEDVSFRKRFDTWPGAKNMHHAYRHGLLQHTLEVTDIACGMAEKQCSWGYPPLSKNLIVAGALLHDVGKVYEIETDGDDYSISRRGKLFGHINIGQMWVNKKINKIPDFPLDVQDAIIHIIDAHHGRPEYGSAKPPMFAEAQIVHMADLLNVQLYYFHETSQTASQEFLYASKLEGRQVYNRSWRFTDDIDGVVPADVRIEETPGVYSVPQVGNNLPKFRFHTSDSTPNTVFHTLRMPLVGRAAAGMPVFSEEHIENYFEVEDERLSAGDYYLLRIDGDSMTGDGIQDQDTVVVRRQSSQEPEIISVVYFDDRSEAAIKRIAKTKIDGIELLSSNPHYAPIPVADPSSLRVSGRVIGILQNPESDIHAS